MSTTSPRPGALFNLEERRELEPYSEAPDPAIKFAWDGVIREKEQAVVVGDGILPSFVPKYWELPLYQRPRPQDPAYSDKEAIAIWDAVIGSIRPRDGAVVPPPPSPSKPQSMSREPTP